MGQRPGKASPCVELGHQVIKKEGARVSKSQLLDCLQVVYYNPWFPEEGTLDEEVLDRVQKNIANAYKQEENFTIQFWVAWALIQTTSGILKIRRLLITRKKWPNECKLENQP